MIFVWGKRSFFTLQGDQSAIAEAAFTPCLKRGCRGRKCQLYRHERWCTIYFCIPVMPLQNDVVVKCETCGTMWLQDQYFRMVQAIAQRLAQGGGLATTPVAFEAPMERQETNNEPIMVEAIPVDDDDDNHGENNAATSTKEGYHPVSSIELV